MGLLIEHESPLIRRQVQSQRLFHDRKSFCESAPFVQDVRKLKVVLHLTGASAHPLPKSFLSFTVSRRRRYTDTQACNSLTAPYPYDHRASNTSSTRRSSARHVSLSDVSS